MKLEPLPESDTEGDTEAKIVLPILTMPTFLGIPTHLISSKKFLPRYDLGKGQKKLPAYVPDFMVNVASLPMLVVESKAPDKSAEVAYQEAGLYAHKINSEFPSGVNPCSFILSTNGIDITVGAWDSKPVIKANVADFTQGSQLLKDVRDMISFSSLSERANYISERIRSTDFKRPFNQGIGPTLISGTIRLTYHTRFGYASWPTGRCQTPRKSRSRPRWSRRGLTSLIGIRRRMGIRI